MRPNHLFHQYLTGDIVRFKGLDLNLLCALEALLSERNVTRAAERLHLSQSATSNALSRLREQLDDELLVQVGRGLELSQRAKELLPKVRFILGRVESDVLHPTNSSPKEAKRYIRIMASDYVTSTVLARTIGAIAVEAPGLRFEVVPVTANPSVAIENYAIDLLITLDKYLSGEHPCELFFDDDYVAVCCAKSRQYESQLSMEDYRSAQQIVVRFQPNSQETFEQKYLEQCGIHRQIKASTSSHALLPYFIENTDILATVQRRQAVLLCQHFPLRMLEIPVAIPRLREMFQWHQSNDGDSVLQYVRTRLMSAL